MASVDIIKSKEHSECPICKSKGTYLYKNLDDRLFGNSKGWHLKKCNNENCKLLWLDPMPTEDEIWKAYADYYTHSEQKKSFFYSDRLAKCYLSLKYGYYPQLGIFKKLLGALVYLNPLLKSEVDFKVLYLRSKSGGKVLDYGCGNGWLLSELKKLGWETYGMDFDPKAIEYCQTQGLDVTLPDFERFSDSYFDAITINHVIEHVHDFEGLLEKCFLKLKSGGTISIATPNTDNWVFKKYGSNWMQLDPPRHLQLFNLKNLGEILQQKGFEIRKDTSSIRIDAWAAIVSREIKRNGYFHYGDKKKSKWDVLVGVGLQMVVSILKVFNKKVGGELILVAEKP